MTVADLVEFTEERRGQVIALLGHLNEGLPTAVGQRKLAEPGFVNEPRPRACPDCLANGGPTRGCETCGGGGVVAPNRVGLIAVTDAFPDDGDDKDPYQRNDVRAYGLTGAAHDRRVQIESAIARARNELRRFPGFRPVSAGEEIDEANRVPYPWERERARIRAMYDIERTELALAILRDKDPSAASLVSSVYVYGEPWELSSAVEEKLEQALRFLSSRLPGRLRAPGDPDSPAAERITTRRRVG
jgi:hypothetical protein